MKKIILFILLFGVSLFAQRFDWENKTDIKNLRTHNTKDFQSLTNPKERIKIIGSGLMHAFVDNEFKELKDVPCEFPEGKILSNPSSKHYIMDLPSWGTAKVENGGKVVRIYDEKNVSTYIFRNPIVTNVNKKAFKVVKKNNKIKEIDNHKEPLEIDEVLLNNDDVDECTFLIEDNKLHFVLPPTLKNVYPLKVFDAVDNASTNNGDTYIDSATPTTNNGTSASIYCGYWTTLETIRTILKWTLSSGTAVITQISLFAYVKTLSGSVTIEVHELTRDFVEAQATWNIYSTGNNWTTAGGDYSATVVDVTATPAATNWQQWDLVGGASDNPISGLTWGSTIRLLLKFDAESGSNRYGEWYSKEYTTDTTKRPYIQITYTPPFIPQILIF